MNEVGRKLTHDGYPVDYTGIVETVGSVWPGFMGGGNDGDDYNELEDWRCRVGWHRWTKWEVIDKYKTKNGHPVACLSRDCLSCGKLEYDTAIA